MSRSIEAGWTVVAVMVVLLSAQGSALAQDNEEKQEQPQPPKQLPEALRVPQIPARGGLMQPAQKLREAQVRGIPMAQAVPPPVINLGPIVTNLVSAKVQKVGGTLELIIAKFGRPELPSKTVPTVSYQQEKRTRTVTINGETKEEEYTINIPVTTLVSNPRFVPTETDRSIAVDLVQAFDLKGNSVDKEVWTKSLAESKHVLLISEPMGPNKQLDPFFSAILREDLLLLYLKNPPEPPKDE